MLVELLPESGKLCLCVLCAYGTSYIYNSSGMLEVHSKGAHMSEKNYGLHHCLYQCILYRYEKTSWAVAL